MQNEGSSLASQTPASRVVVLGGGIFGVSSAVHLARLGAQVTLVTEGGFSSGASGRSLSWLNSARFRSMPYHQLRMAGIDRYRTLIARHPEAAAWLRFDGGLTWDAEGDGNDIAKAYAYERSIGYDAVRLRADEVDSVTPGVDPASIGPEGAKFNPGEGWVDLPSLVEHLLGQFSALGGTTVFDAGRGTVETAGGRVTGIATTKAGRFAADAVLLAAGPAVPAIVREVGAHIPDATPISLLVRTEPLHHPLRAVLNTPRVAVRPTPTGAFVLDAAWSEEEVSARGDGTYEVRDSTVRGLLDEASAVLAGRPKLALDGYGVGPKPIPKDGDPVFGPLDEMSGYYVAFSHSGATLGLIAGELLAEEIVTGTSHPMLESFRPARFGKA
jgi:glycine/D-amino acid oxidase-like deaminating enzyme